MSVRIERLPLHGPLFEGALDVYADAFAGPPYFDDDRGQEVRMRLLGEHGRRPGFRGIVAMEGDEVVGMTYAYTGGPGQWWHEEVRKRIPAAAYRRWLVRSVEVVEVAVSPKHQGKGIGTQMVEALLEGREEHTAVLSARCDSRAHELYRRLGFEEIARVTFSTAGAPFYIMGRQLPPANKNGGGG